MFDYILDNIDKEEYDLRIENLSKCNECNHPVELCDCSQSDNEDNTFSDIDEDIDDIPRLINEENVFIHKNDKDYHLYQNDTIIDDNLIIPFISNINLDIFQYDIINDYFMITKFIESLKLDKEIGGLNSNKYYLKFIKNLPWTKELDSVLDTYTNCKQLMENHFMRIPDRKNITFCNVPTKYNKFYYKYVLQTNELCAECQKDPEICCLTYNKLDKFINNKFKKKINLNMI